MGAVTTDVEMGVHFDNSVRRDVFVVKSSLYSKFYFSETTIDHAMITHTVFVGRLAFCNVPNMVSPEEKCCRMWVFIASLGAESIIFFLHTDMDLHYLAMYQRMQVRVLVLIFKATPTLGPKY